MSKQLYQKAPNYATKTHDCTANSALSDAIYADYAVSVQFLDEYAPPVVIQTADGLSVPGAYEREIDSDRDSTEYYSLPGRARDDYDYSPGARVRAREGRPKWAEVEGLYTHYMATFGRTTVAPSIRADIARMMAAGVSVPLIMAAVDTSADAPRPSWAYARAIIDRCIRERVFDLAAYEQRQQRYRQRNKGSVGYAQRDLTDSDFDTGFYVDVMNRRPGNERDKR